MASLASSGPNGMFRSLAFALSAHAGSGVPKLNPNQNNAPAAASGQEVDDFSQLLDASVIDSSTAAQTPSLQFPATGDVPPKQTKFDPLQATWSSASGNALAIAANVPDTASLLPADGTTIENTKPRVFADLIQFALPSSATAEASDAAKPIAPADAQKEDAPPASHSQSDPSASAVSISIPAFVMPLPAAPVADTSDTLAVAKVEPTSASSAPHVSASLDSPKVVTSTETLAFQAHLLPEPAAALRLSDVPMTAPPAPAPPPANSSAWFAENLKLTPSQDMAQSAAPTVRAGGDISFFDNNSSVRESTGATVANDPAGRSFTASPAFNEVSRIAWKSPGESHSHQDSDSPARTDSIVSLPATGAATKTPDGSSSTQSSTGTQAMPMQQSDGSAASQSKTDITFRLQGQSGESVSVRVFDRAGDIQIAVRSTDPGTAAALRHDLPGLQSGLERAGWHMESSAASTQSPAAMHQAGRSNGGAPDQPRQGAQHRAEDYSQHGRRRSSPDDRWLEMINANT